MTSCSTEVSVSLVENSVSIANFSYGETNSVLAIKLNSKVMLVMD